MRLFKITGFNDGNYKKNNLKKKSSTRKGRKARSNGRRRTRSRSRSRSRSSSRKNRKTQNKRRKKRSKRSYRKRRGGGLAGQQPFGYTSEPATVSGMTSVPSVGDVSNPYFSFSGSKLSPMDSALASAGKTHNVTKNHGSFFKK